MSKEGRRIVIRTVFALLFFTLALLHCSSRINFLTADLGRHLRNGGLFVNFRQVLATNFYSYTHTDFPTICHHWGSGVLFFLITKSAGFLALSAFYAGILALTVLLFMASAGRVFGYWNALLASLLALPLIAYRTEIRPEGLTTLFLGLFFFLLMEFRARRLGERWLWLLLPVQFLWVNAHILFFLGFLLIGLFAIDEIVASWAWGTALMPNLRRLMARGSRFRTLLRLGISSVAVSTLNPAGLAGLAEPFNIFREYGYELAENQNVFFMIKRFPETSQYGYFLFLLAISALALLFWAWREKQRRRFFLPVILFVVFGLMAVKAVRAIAMFGFFFIPVFAEGLFQTIRFWSQKWSRYAQKAVAGLAAGSILAAMVFPAFFLSPVRRHAQFFSPGEDKYRNCYFYLFAHPNIWAGLYPGVDTSAQFFEGTGLKGPIFNNYDIGGYLIYHLFPQEKTFVDNRPEAYPAKFFKDVYVAAQEKDSVWQEVEAKYGFQVIYFYHRDITPWAQPFLINRIKDPNWAPVFADQYAIILARRGGVNQAVIDRYEISKSAFKITEKN